jgi:glycosyltransferase involved in cell wall biosynthesis/predicted SAM-dependent methyltransferase
MPDRASQAGDGSAHLRLVQSTHSSLSGMEESGLLGRYRRTLEWYVEAFEVVTVYSSDTVDYGETLGVAHRHPEWLPSLFGLRHMGYYLWLVLEAGRMEGVVKVVGSNIPTLGLVRLLAGKRMAVTYQFDYAGLAAREHGRVSAWALVARLMEAAAILPADLVEATTPNLAQKIRMVYHRPTVVVPNWLDLEACRATASDTRDPDLIVYAGRLHRIKGVDGLLEALAKLIRERPEARLVICGQGEEEDRLRAFTARLGLASVTFAGRVDNAECLSLFGRAAAFVLPTTASEGHPKALIEAMACGAACVVTDVPGSNELISDGENGLVVPPNDSNALAAALLSILGHEDVRSSLGERATESVARLDIGSVMPRDIEALKSLSSRRQTMSDEMDQFTWARYSLIATIVKECTQTGSTVLDLGVGRRPISALVQAREVTAMDIDPDVHPSIVCDFTAGLPLDDDSIDCIIAGEVLEHLTNGGVFVREMRRVIRLGGSVVLSVPNATSLKYRIAWLLGRVPAHAARADYTYPPGHPAHPRGHVRDYNFREIEQLFGDNGFSVVERQGIGTYQRGKLLVSPRLLPVTLSDQVIVRAVAI